MTRSWSYILQLFHEFILLVDNKLSLQYHQNNCGSAVLELQLLLLRGQKGLRYPIQVPVPLNEF
jgi:hypothetical protein